MCCVCVLVCVAYLLLIPVIFRKMLHFGVIYVFGEYVACTVCGVRVSAGVLCPCILNLGCVWYVCFVCFCHV